MSAQVLNDSGSAVVTLSTGTVRNLLSKHDVSVELVRMCPVESRWFVTLGGETYTVTAFPYDEDHRLLLKASERKEK